MHGRFWHVGDVGPRKVTIDPGTADLDRSVAADVWFRADNLTHNQILLESGDGTTGLSLTLGDADANGSFNDLRFRIRGANGDALTVTVPINTFADPTADFVHATAVFNDDSANRYAEIYINGALAGRVDGIQGDEASLRWDGYDDAGIGKAGGAGLGANAGTGPLPFNGTFAGKIAGVNFWNHAVTPLQVAANYNSKLDPVGFGVSSVAGSSLVPESRPTDVSKGAAESNSLLVMQERGHRLAGTLQVDGVFSGGETGNAANPFIAGSIAAGTEFTSYLFHFDPVGSIMGNSTITGSVTLAYDVTAIITDAAKLSTTDRILGSIGAYGDVGDRGLTLSGADYIAVSADRRTLTYNLTVANNDVLEFRILTLPTLPTDFNGDGEVDAADLAQWNSSADATTGFADADFDGDSDGADFLAWQRTLGTTATSAVVPEPAAGLLGAIALGVAFGLQQSFGIRLRRNVGGGLS
jgi:hypothetical protein